MTSARPLPAFLRFIVAILVALATAGFARAEDDLPGRVGRLADVGGRVYVSTSENAEDWVEALRNYSITSGDNVWVAEDGRAEIDYGGGQLRLAGDTNVHVSRLDDRILALFVAQGRVILRVRVLDAGEAVRVDTPNTQVSLNRPGLYRVEVSEDRDRTTLIVREGEATATLAQGSQQVLPGQSATLTGDEPDYAEVRNGFFVDGFDSWSAERDRRYERGRATAYVSRQMVGYPDLDEYGTWRSYPEYGAVWFPRGVPGDWAPYRYGRWTWVTGFGWTWVDDAPWGYAPFHYGRWTYIGTRWGWIPGGYVARPVWAPALVAWYGGPGWSVSVGAPVFGWVALGWGEPYIPWWRNCSHRCWTMYNRPYAVNHAERPSAPPTRYVNWNAPGGVTAAHGAVFTGRREVHNNLVSVPPRAVSAAPVLAGAPVIAKPTPGAIPGAKPTASAPPPAERFIRKPLQIAPTAPMPSTATPSWGGGSTGPRGPTSSPPGRVQGAPGQIARPPVTAAPPATSAAPAARAPSSSASRPVTPVPGTWGAPAAPRPQAASPAQPRVAPPASAPPATAAPPAAARTLPPATTATRPIQPRPAPSGPSAGVPMPRSAPPAGYSPPAAPQPRAMPQAPAPQAAKPAPQAARPAPQAPAAAPPPARSAPSGQAQKPAPRGPAPGDKDK